MPIKNILEDNGFEVDSFYDPILVLNYYKVIFLCFSNSRYEDAKNGWISIIY